MKEIIKNPILLLLSLSIFTGTTSFVGTIPQLLLWSITTVAILFADGSKVLNRRPVLLLTLFYIIVFLYAFLDHGVVNAQNYRGPIVCLISAYAVFSMSYHIKKFSFKQIRILLFVGLASLGISIVITTYISTIDPMALRAFGFGGAEASEALTAASYFSMGMMSYSSAHSMSIIAMGMCVLICYAKNKILRIIGLLATLLLIRLFFVMTITTALLATLVGCAIIFAFRLSKGRIVKLIVTTATLSLLIFMSGSLLTVLDLVSTTDNKEISAKLIDISSSIKNGESEGQMGYREYLYTVSFNTFLSNPILGWGKDNGSKTVIGEHSFLLDYLAYYGILAFLFFGAWWKEYRSVKSYLSQKFHNLHMICIIPLVILVATKGSFAETAYLFMSLVMVQIIFLYIDMDSKKEFR